MESSTSIVRLWNVATTLHRTARYRVWVLKRFAISQISMTPVLEPGDWLVAVLRKRPPRRGDIVIFEPEPGWFVIKRAVGLSGETIEAANGKLLVNGEALDMWAVGRTGAFLPITVPYSHIYLLGDRREVSKSDSRTMGPQPVDEWWQPKLRFGPLRRFGFV